jgi:hypothetical protein
MLIDRGEAAEGYAKGKAQVVRGGLGIELLCVLREWGTFSVIDGLLSPFLGVAPWRRARAKKFDRCLATQLVHIKSFLNQGEDKVRSLYILKGNAIDISDLKANPRVKRLDDVS